MGQVSLDKFIDDNRAELIELTRKKVTGRSSPKTTPLEVEQGVPIFLSQLSTTLKDVAANRAPESTSPRVTPAITKSAESHGLGLFKLGFTIEQVVHDYGDVCQAVTELAEKRGTTLTIVEFQTLNRCLDNAIAGAVTSWTLGRQNATPEVRVAAMKSDPLKTKLLALVDQANLAMEALRTGTLGISGATGEVLRRSLIDLRAVIDKGE
jgi:hypothetical protein